MAYVGDTLVDATPDEPMPVQELTAYRPSAHPGARLPHALLTDGRSLYDLLGDGFTLLRLASGADPGPLLEAAQRGGVPVQLVDLASLPQLRSGYGADLVLVRPDQHVAWRGPEAVDADSVVHRVVRGNCPPTVARADPSAAALG